MPFSLFVNKMVHFIVDQSDLNADRNIPLDSKADQIQHNLPKSIFYSRTSILDRYSRENISLFAIHISVAIHYMITPKPCNKQISH